MATTGCPASGAGSLWHRDGSGATVLADPYSRGGTFAPTGQRKPDNGGWHHARTILDATSLIDPDAGPDVNVDAGAKPYPHRVAHANSDLYTHSYSHTYLDPYPSAPIGD